MSRLTYEATRITYQSDEQMARAFFALAGELTVHNSELTVRLAAAAGEQVPYGWLQFIDGVKTQNFARDEKELADIKMVARVMKVAGHIEYVPVFAAIAAQSGKGGA